MVECSPHIRIFASSPADVADERKELKKVVEELARRRTCLAPPQKQGALRSS
jgi:hypothetical protein